MYVCVCGCVASPEFSLEPTYLPTPLPTRYFCAEFTLSMNGFCALCAFVRRPGRLSSPIQPPPIPRNPLKKKKNCGRWGRDSCGFGRDGNYEITALTTNARKVSNLHSTQTHSYSHSRTKAEGDVCIDTRLHGTPRFPIFPTAIFRVSLFVARQQKFVGQFPSQQISAMLLQGSPENPSNSAASL